MVAVTRSHGPLHFEDLDPKRFEDLVRQLLYDFRPWVKLEPTGRSGSDDGFDARGTEIEPSPDYGDADEADESQGQHRTWLIQCKREKSIPPRKLMAYLEGIVAGCKEPLYGIIFVAACDFSKAARDQFNARCRSEGVKEWFLLGKADLEDLLYRPQYDRLLFGYFGVSLGRDVTRKYAALRKGLVGKRKALRGLVAGREVLVRSVADLSYPSKGDGRHPGWARVRFVRATYQGLIFDLHRHFAVLTSDGEWDAAFALDEYDPEALGDDFDEAARQARSDLWQLWYDLADEKAWFMFRGCIPFDNIVEVDADGDDLAEFPHLYVEPSEGGRLFPLHGSAIEAVAGFVQSISIVDFNDRRTRRFEDRFRERPADYTRL